MIVEEQVLHDGTVGLLTIRGDFWEEEWLVHDKVGTLIDRDVVNVVIDLSSSRRINSQGIGVLVSCMTSLRDAGGDLKIAGANSTIQNLLKMVNLYTLLENFESVDEATSSF